MIFFLIVEIIPQIQSGRSNKCSFLFFYKSPVRRFERLKPVSVGQHEADQEKKRIEKNNNNNLTTGLHGVEKIYIDSMRQQ